jgi:hypothetical protein
MRRAIASFTVLGLSATAVIWGCASDSEVGANGPESVCSTEGGCEASDAAAGGSESDSETGAHIIVPDSDGGTTDCNDNVRPIYVLNRETLPGTIHRFDPGSLTFTEVLVPACPDSSGWEVASMAIDRAYHAWIRWSRRVEDKLENRLDRVNLATGTCDANYAAPPIAAGLGMAFVSDSSMSAAEHIFFVDASTNLYRLGDSEPIGHFYDFQPGQGTQFSGLELTGTGEGRLFTMIMNWSFEWDHPCTAENPCYPTVHLGEFNKVNGTAISNIEVPDVKALGISPGGLAFAHWGGHFWFFISKDFGPTLVYDYDPLTNKTLLARSDGPAGIVGAGVSTCAPLEFPK